MCRNTAKESIAELIYTKIKGHNGCTKCYHWRSFDEIVLPETCTDVSKNILRDVCLMKGSEAEQVVEFRKLVSEHWRNYPNDREELRDLVVQIWGGMPGQRIKQVNLLSLDLEKQLLERCGKSSLVAATSKLLAAIDPSNYFVFDSRISVYLNKLIDEKCERDFGFGFQLVPGRSRYYTKYKNEHLSRNDLFDYQDYCSILKRVRDKAKAPGEPLSNFDFSNERIQLLELCLYMQAH